MLRLQFGEPMLRWVPAIDCELQALYNAFYRRRFAEAGECIEASDITIAASYVLGWGIAGGRVA